MLTTSLLPAATPSNLQPPVEGNNGRQHGFRHRHKANYSNFGQENQTATDQYGNQTPHHDYQNKQQQAARLQTERNRLLASAGSIPNRQRAIEQNTNN
ncbi:hypothetical protein U1Q18_006581 [Sarracenia purpurea var. burkii]